MGQADLSQEERALVINFWLAYSRARTLLIPTVFVVDKELPQGARERLRTSTIRFYESLSKEEDGMKRRFSMLQEGLMEATRQYAACPGANPSQVRHGMSVDLASWCWTDPLDWVKRQAPHLKLLAISHDNYLKVGIVTDCDNKKDGNRKSFTSSVNI